MDAVFRAFRIPDASTQHPRRPVLAALGIALLLTACSPEYRISALNEQLGGAEMLVRVFLAGVGLLLMLAGFALYEFIIAMIGFMIGGVIGGGGGLAYAGFEDTSALIPALVGFLLGGIIGAALASLLTCVTIFSSGMLIGGAFFAVLWMSLVQEEPEALVIFVGAIIGGIVMLILYRFWITALTSAIGSVMFGLGIGSPPWTWILFFFFGILVQYGLGKASGNEEKVRPTLRPAQKAAPVVAGAAAGAAAGMAGAAAYQRRAAAQQPPYPTPPPPQPYYPAQPVYPPPGAPQPTEPFGQRPGAGGYPPVGYQPPAVFQPQQSAEKVCPACGQKMRAQAAFCPRCGSPQ